jgi:hypothetical protein
VKVIAPDEDDSVASIALVSSGDDAIADNSDDVVPAAGFSDGEPPTSD